MLMESNPEAVDRRASAAASMPSAACAGCASATLLCNLQIHRLSARRCPEKETGLKRMLCLLPALRCAHLLRLAPPPKRFVPVNHTASGRLGTRMLEILNPHVPHRLLELHTVHSINDVGARILPPIIAMPFYCKIAPDWTAKSPRWPFSSVPCQPKSTSDEKHEGQWYDEFSHGTIPFTHNYTLSRYAGIAQAAKRLIAAPSQFPRRHERKKTHWPYKMIITRPLPPVKRRLLQKKNLLPGKARLQRLRNVCLRFSTASSGRRGRP